MPDTLAAIKQFEAELARAQQTGAREQEINARENLATVYAAVGRLPLRRSITIA